MDDGHNTIVDTLLLEYTGIFKILNPHVKKFHDINPFKVATKIELYFLNVTLIMTIISIYYSLNNINIFVSYIMLSVAYSGFSFNYYYLLKNSDAIWNILRVSNIDFMYFNIPNRKTFRAERFKYKLATTVSLIMMVAVCISWIIMPLFVRHSYLTIQFKNNLYNYRCSSMNLLLPVTENFYNKYYNVFYIFEVLMIIFGCHSSIFFDFTIITMCISIECQLKAIANSYRKLVIVEKNTFSNHIF